MRSFGTRALFTLLVCLSALSLSGTGSGLFAQGNATPVPLLTLVPPTPLPPAPTPTSVPPPTRSVIARIRERDPQLLIVGIPFNISPFAAITPTGEIEGFEAAIARAIAEDWGTKIEFRQVTGSYGLQMLMDGQIDLLMGQQVLSRDAQSVLDYSDPIFVGKQVALKMASNPIGDIGQLGGQTVGVVVGSPGEKAFAEWATANGLQANVNRYVMLDDAFRDLGDGKIAAVIGDRWELDRRVRGVIEGVQLLNGVLRTEPYAIAMVRFDENLRTLVNRTLQRLVSTNILKPIYDQWFPPGLMPEDERVIPRIWRDLDADKRTLADFPVDIVRPARSVIDRIKAGEPVRVAGLGAPSLPDGQQSPLERINAAIIYEMARRWGIPVALVPNTFGTAAEEALASGNADIAVGIEPHWGPVDRFDYAALYAERGYKFLVRIGSSVKTFGDLREGRRAIATFADDPNAFDIARKLMISLNIPEATIQNVKVSSEQDGIDAVFEIQSARMLFGDALRIIPLATANSAKVQLGENLYERKPLAFGVPRNDADFRVLVEITFQEMARDGTYARIFKDTWKIGEPLTVIMWPGTGMPFGIKATG